jgi:hypothetical protein
MATVTTDTNNRVRKSLAEQIDRLDGILDGLAEGLNEAVIAAVKEAAGAAVQEAVRAVLSELLANPELLHSVRDSLTPPLRTETHVADQPTESRGTGAATSARLGGCRAWLRARVLGAKGRLVPWLGRARRPVYAASASLCIAAGVARRVWRSLLVALGVGVLVGVAAYLLGPWLSTAAGGLAGFTTSLALQARMALRQALGCFPPTGG